MSESSIAVRGVGECVCLADFLILVSRPSMGVSALSVSSVGFLVCFSTTTSFDTGMPGMLRTQHADRSMSQQPNRNTCARTRAQTQSSFFPNIKWIAKQILALSECSLLFDWAVKPNPLVDQRPS